MKWEEKFMLSFFLGVAYPSPAQISMPELKSHLAAREMEKYNVILGSHGAQLKIVLLWGKGRL